MVINEIVEQHAEEAAFLWTQRDKAVLAPNYSLKDLARLDERVEAHLDGLRIAGDAGWELCEQTLREGMAGEVFACAVLAFEGSNQTRIRKVLEHGSAKPAFARALISALGWLRFEQAKPCLNQLVRDADPRVRRVGIAGFGVHRQDPGAALIDAMTDSDNRLKARAIEAVAELGRRDLAGYIRSPDSESDEDCRFAAAWTLARFGWGSRVLKSIADEGDRHAEQALGQAMRTMEVGAAGTWCRTLLNNPDKSRFGIIGAGLLGDPGLVDDLVLLMGDAKLARIAGEAVSMITGLDLKSVALDGKAPEGLKESPSEDPESEDVAVDPDENLSWPLKDKVEAWWNGRRADFVSGVRYSGGQEITIDSLRRTLLNGTQSQRAAAALGLAVLDANSPLVEVRERADRQMRRVTPTGN